MNDPTPEVLLVQPPYGAPYNFWKAESLGMGYLASALEARGFVVGVLNAFLLDLDVDEVVDRVLANPPRLLLGFSMLSYELYRTGDTILRRLRARGFTAHVTAGSWFPTFWYQTMLAEGFPVDSIVLGEGERTICALAEHLRNGRWDPSATFLVREEVGGVQVLSQRGTLLDVDSLPHPRRDYLPHVFGRYHLATSYTARGCGYNRCTFCSVPSFYKGGPKHRLRSPANVVSEVGALADSGVNFLFFSDEDFLGEPPGGPARALEIFEGVASRGIPMRYTFNCTTMGVTPELFERLVELGLAAVYIGMESSLDRTLKLFAKGVRSPQVHDAVAILRDLDVKLVPGWIMFERKTTLDEVEAQIGFLSQLEAYHVNYLKSLYVMKDTPMERAYRNELYATHFHSRYYFEDPDVDLLVRIIQDDYLPETMPNTNSIYPIWHKLLAGYGTDAQQAAYERINTTMRELSLGFTTETIQRIRSRSLQGLAATLTDHVRAWRSLGAEIDALAARMGSSTPRSDATGPRCLGLGKA